MRNGSTINKGYSQQAIPFFIGEIMDGKKESRVTRRLCCAEYT